jgi:23S rRNA (uridine2552-2'-O)-methyltransferase
VRGGPGATPGAWSQYLRRRLSPQGRGGGQLNGTIIALDILPMEPIEGVHFMQGDFREDEVLAQPGSRPGRPAGGRGGVGHGAQPVGHRVGGRARALPPGRAGGGLCRAAPEPEGALVVKLFHGSGYSQLVELFKQRFRVVKPIKPKASRARSPRLFWWASAQQAAA